MPDPTRPPGDAWLDLLADEVARRLAERQPPTAPEPAAAAAEPAVNLDPAGSPDTDGLPASPVSVSDAPAAPPTVEAPEPHGPAGHQPPFSGSWFVEPFGPNDATRGSASEVPSPSPSGAAPAPPDAGCPARSSTAGAGGSRPAVSDAEDPAPPVGEPPASLPFDLRPVRARAVAPAAHAAAPLLARLAAGVLLVVGLINLPVLPHGAALARSIPNTVSIVIRPGLLVQEAGSPEVWVYRDGGFRWITSLDLFRQLGYRWEDVHPVEPGFLAQFERGRPISLLQKCLQSPHVYRIEDGRKRWIVDLDTFRAEGHTWGEIVDVPCETLRRLPDGETIPSGRGTPPLPRP